MCLIWVVKLIIFHLSRRNLPGYGLFLGLICQCLAVQSSGADVQFNPVVNVFVEASSDQIYHGLSESNGEPGASISVDLQLSEGWFAGGTVSEANVEGLRQRQRSHLLFVGTGFALNDQWYLSGAIKRRDFVNSQKDWNYTEWELRLAHRSGLLMHLDYADNYYDHRNEAIASQVSWLRDINSTYYWGLGVGYLTLSADVDHIFGHANLGLSKDNLNVDLKYHWHNRKGIVRFAERLEQADVVMQISYKFR